ncbi:MAG: DegT/DnrJ/EryC1/StrS family aminotransferase [Pseudomonadota bacterium]
MTNADFIPVNTPRLGAREKALINECLDSGWISSEGPYIARFEQAVAQKLGRRHAIAVCNGTAALQVAVDALQLGPGDEVILPSLTIISCVAAIIRAGATPVLVDSDPLTWNMDVRQVAARVTPRTKAIMPVHLYGLSVDLDPLLALAARHGLAIIEDAAEGLGGTYRGRPCGSFGTLSTLSFYPNKLVTTGEGGMVLTDDDQLALRCRRQRNLCFLEQRRFLHEELGWNYRMTSLQAALGLAQLEAWDEHLALKSALGARYQEGLAGLRGVQHPLATGEQGDANVYWVYGLVLDDAHPLDAEAAMRALAERGIGTRPFFWPLHEQPVLHARGLCRAEQHPVASRLARRGFYLPSGLALSVADQQRVIAGVRALMS